MSETEIIVNSKNELALLVTQYVLANLADRIFRVEISKADQNSSEIRFDLRKDAE